MNPIELEKSAVDKEPYLVWNAFIELIGNDPDKLTDAQAVPSMAFHYDSEVQNRGHVQYFENVSINYHGKEEVVVAATLQALKIIGAGKQARILSQASKRYFSKSRKRPANVEEFVAAESEDEFGEFDDRYYECDPDMNVHLERYLQRNASDFVKVV